ncbi:hypothetical protein MMAN_01580 [Mycobacterium mantenii]|uniref:DNA-binding protein n=2 Tax=Mycobacterium mantenii TaxID=560555 RepID=A0ABM7JKS0_MYCNT|nr:DUF177 domain-containing protein [Mycobacterium mantenii]MCV7246104.1 DUF177 domain-containing protein [Mycobacterium mantenii]BBY36024.1 hypothetical protein MMAN_01580 [Mycobacterium mantenii]
MTRQHSTSSARGAASRLAGPMAFDITRLGRRPGAMVTLRKTVPSPSRIGLDMIAIEADAPLELDLQIQSVSEGVLVTGTVEAPTTGECSRCLTRLDGHMQVRLTELFAYPDSTTEATTEEDEVGHIVDDTIDLEQAIVDAVGLELPFSPVCSPDCPGLCPECGVSLAAEPSHQHERIDPRWAKLSGMFSTEADEPRGER